MSAILLRPIHVNTLRPRQNVRHFADHIFKCIFWNENVGIPIKISLKYVPKGPINNIPALVKIMAWRRSGDKPLSEPMMTGFPTLICVTRPQWVKALPQRPPPSVWDPYNGCQHWSEALPLGENRRPRPLEPSVGDPGPRCGDEFLPG